MTDPFIDKPAINKPLIGVAVALAIAAAAAWHFWPSRAKPQPARTVQVESQAPKNEPEDRIEHPVPAAANGAPAAALPDLGDSDAAMRDALSEATQDMTLAQYWVPESVIRHLVVTVDNLPRPKVAVDKRPFKPAPGPFMVSGDELHASVDPQNFQRYAAPVALLRKTDMQRLAAVYFRFYPLFQRAYQDLGYPNGYFNDRLVQVIDVLLATPQNPGAFELMRPNVMYVFADPMLEARPAGQKMLIRMGPNNAAAVKAKLTELRAIITAAPPKH